MSLSAGVGKHETTCFISGIGMMGYGQPHNIVKEVGTPLFARALFIHDSKKNNVLLVHLEQAFVSIAIKEEILTRIQRDFPEWKITDANLMITAQHTHSAPGGYSHYPFYNFTIPGLQLIVFKTICDGIMQAALAAFKDLSEVKIHFGTHMVSDQKEVAFNRSMKAYLNNSDADPTKSVNREMEGLRFITPDGKEKAMINWFGVHCTSISSFNHRIHHDNKGVAAKLYEDHHPGSTAFFMQSAAGDISPNFVWDPELKRTRGKYQDQYMSVEHNGEIQFREAEKVSHVEDLQGEIKTFSQFMNMSEVVAAPAHGVAFFEGTKEGPGVSPILGNILRVITRGVKHHKVFKDPEKNKKFYEAHYPKDILLDHRTGAFLGISLGAWKKIPAIPEPAVEAFRKCAKNESINTLPWVPEILPFQIVVIGTLLIAAVPGEITTTAARRLKKFIENKLAKTEIKQVIISSYANAYMGYITTPEEYVTQSYEAGHTIYGRQTLDGVIKGFEGILNEFLGQIPKNSKLTPFHFPAGELALRTVP